MSDQPLLSDKPRYTYTAELMGKMTPRTSGIRRRASNWTAYGSEAVVAFASAADEEPQLYRVFITPLHRYDDGTEAATVDDLLYELRRPSGYDSQQREEIAIWNGR